MNATLSREIADLTIPERIELIEELWNSIPDDEVALPLTSEQRREIDRRLDIDPASPEAAHRNWSEIRDELKRRG